MSSFNIKTIISLEGNIGAGKSSFMKILRNKLADIAEFIDEPIDEWLEMKNNQGQNLLDVFYKDKKRWAYSFQNIAYITRMKRIMNILMTSNKSLIIMDRSLEGDINTFSKMLKESGDIDELEWQAYHKWNTFFTDYIGKNIKTYHVYLKTSPQIAYERIKKRHRDEESIIPFDYIKQLHEYHENWLMHLGNVVLINVNNDFVENENNANLFYAKLYSELLKDFF